MVNKELQTALGYSFQNPALLQQALTHSSYSHEKGLSAGDCNERLEFLGDAVLEFSTSDFLYQRYPGLSEGELTKCRAGLVCESSLASLARSLGLGRHLRLGRGEELSGGRERDSLLADALEAILGAMFLDGGIESTRTVIHRLFAPVAAERLSKDTDHKTALQEILQKNSRESAAYEITHETGPSHQKEFTATVSHQGRWLGTGTGRSKKEAEQNAAYNALQRIDSV